jgi:hypothetical protein
VIAEVKQHLSGIGWATKNLLSRVFPCFGRHVQPLHLPVRTGRALSYGSLCVILKEGLCPSSGDINRLMMMMTLYLFLCYSHLCFGISNGSTDRSGLKLRINAIF